MSEGKPSCFWRCRECGNEFWGGGRPLHQDTCPLAAAYFPRRFPNGELEGVFGPYVGCDLIPEPEEEIDILGASGMNPIPIEDFPVILAATVEFAGEDAARGWNRYRIPFAELTADDRATLQAAYDERYAQGAPVRPLASIPSYWLLPGDGDCEVRAVERAGAYYLLWIHWVDGQPVAEGDAGPFPNLAAALAHYDHPGTAAVSRGAGFTDEE